MKTLQHLMQELCPNGVEFKKLGEVTAWDKKFNGVDKRLQAKVITYKYLLAKEAEALEVENGDVFILNTGNKISWTNREKAGEYLAEGEVVSIPWGGYANVKYYKGAFVTTDNRICTSLDTSVLSNKFLYYYLKHHQKDIDSFYRGAGIKHPSMFSVLTFEVPVPPLAVQEKIVNILDRFAALTAELQARQQQYEYYRDRLLSFGGRDNIHCIDDDGVDRTAHGSADECNGGGYKWLKIREICQMKFDRISYSDLTISNYTSVENLLKDRGGRCDCDTTPSSGSFVATKPNDILIGNIRPYLRKIWFSNCKGGTNGDVIVVRLTSDGESIVIPKYLFYQLSSERFFNYDNAHVKAGKMPRGDKSAIFNFEIPIPPLSEQQRIVDILDRFEALTNDLTSGLPAEIEARQQQYEYYRNRLLSFERLQ